MILEARDRVGGRTWNGQIDAETDIELGGEFFGSGQDRAYALTKELGLETFANHSKGKNLFEQSEGLITTYRGNVPKLNLPALLDVAQAQLRFELLARHIVPEAPWKTSKAAVYDSLTLADWMQKNLKTSMGKRLFTLVCQEAWCEEPQDISLLHALFYARAAGSLNKVISSQGGAQQDRVVGGTQRLALELASRLTDELVYKAPATRIEQPSKGVAVHTARDTFRANHVVVAVPLTLVNTITFSPELPNEMRGLLANVQMGKVIKVMAVYEKPFWRDEGFSGSAISLIGPMGVVLDNTPANGKYGVLLGFIGGRRSVEFGALPERTRKDQVTAAFGRLFGPEAETPIKYIETDWNSEAYTLGGYAATFKPGTWTQYGSALREPHGRIYWTGAEQATKWYGYIDGAIRSGESTAQQILALID